MNQPYQDAERRDATSASNAAADLACPGRHFAQRAFPNKSGPYAEHGRRIHDALAYDSRANTGVNPSTLSLPERETFERCRDIEKKLALQLFPEAGNAMPLRVFREQRFWCRVQHSSNPRVWFEHSGKPDVVMRCGTTGLIQEYKTLPGEVPGSPDNLQLRDQVVLAAGHLLLDQCYVVVNQPAVTMEPVLTLYRRDDIKLAEQELFERVRKSNDPKSPRLAGEVQCQFCRAKNNCLEYQKFAGAMLPSFLSILDVPVASWTPEQRALFCTNRRIAQKWLDETSEAIREGLSQDPAFVAGWHLRPGNRVRTVTDPQGVFNRYAALGGKVEQFMKSVSVSIGDLREAVHALTGATGKGLDAAMATLLDGMVAESQNRPSLKENSEPEDQP